MKEGPTPTTSHTLHATAFAAHGVGCLLLGPSGAGKTRLAAEAMALGARLIGDDQLELNAVAGQLIASAPATLAGIMELRGLGLIRVPNPWQQHPIHLVISLHPTASSDRLPEGAMTPLCGLNLPHFCLPSPPKTSAASLLLYVQAMQEGRTLPPDWHPTAF